VFSTIEIRHLVDDEGGLTSILVFHPIDHIDASRHNFQILHLCEKLRFPRIILQEDVCFHVLSETGICGFTPPTFLVSDEVVSSTRFTRLLCALAIPNGCRSFIHIGKIDLIKMSFCIFMINHAFYNFNSATVEDEVAGRFFERFLNGADDVVTWPDFYFFHV